MPLAVRASIVDVRTDSPSNSDVFLVDSNAWLWAYYPRQSQLSNGAPHAHQANDYPDYLKRAILAGSTLRVSPLSLPELAHQIEKTECEIYNDLSGRALGLKKFRQDCPGERRKVVKQVADVWRDITTVATVLDVDLTASRATSAITFIASAEVDGYDLYLADQALTGGIPHVITDDADYSTVRGLTIFTANPAVINAAASQGRIIVRGSTSQAPP